MEKELIKTSEPLAANTSFYKAIHFLKEIGIPVHFLPIESDCFLPGLSIVNGEIFVDIEKLKFPGDIIHEAGYIAVVPSAERMTLNAESIKKREQRDAEEI